MGHFSSSSLGFFFIAILFISCSVENKNLRFTDIIKNGKTENAIVMGKKWASKNDYLECSGKGDNFDNMLYSSFYVNDNDFHIKAKLSLEKLDGTTSIFWFFNNHFGFDSNSEDPEFQKRLFIYTPKLDSVIYLEKASTLIAPNEPFDFEVIRKNEILSFFINNTKITEQFAKNFSQPFKGAIGFRPWRNTMRIYDWSIDGDFSDIPHPEFVFQSGEGGYACFRIPSIAQTKDGNFASFCRRS